MSTLQIAGRTYSWKSGTWEQADRQPLRVFRFADDAWQCEKVARVCYVRRKDNGGAVNIEIGDGYECVPDIVGRYDTRDAPEATRLSTWDEWFDLTLAAAAHAYLDEAMRMSRRRCRASAFRLSVAVRAMCDAQMAHDLIDFESTAYESGELMALYPARDYLRHVKVDLGARLCGEVGDVVLP